MAVLLCWDNPLMCVCIPVFSTVQVAIFAVSTIVLSCDIMMYSNVLLLNQNHNIIHAVDKVVPESDYLE